jgi:hypothetical protein
MVDPPTLCRQWLKSVQTQRGGLRCVHGGPAHSGRISAGGSGAKNGNTSLPNRKLNRRFWAAAPAASRMGSKRRPIAAVRPLWGAKPSPAEKHQGVEFDTRAKDEVAPIPAVRRTAIEPPRLDPKLPLSHCLMEPASNQLDRTPTSERAFGSRSRSRSIPWQKGHRLRPRLERRRRQAR